jgi:hypothetical protein
MILTGGPETLQAAAAATGNGTAMDVAGQHALAVQVSGTFVGTVTFEGTLDDTNWVSVGLVPFAGGAAVTSATAPGVWSLGDVPLSQFRARISAYTSGTITVVGRKGL